jgi:poly(3-hydroxybutyrate) depolymerase
VRLRFSAALVAVVAVSGTPAAHAATTQLPPLPRIAPSCVESDFTSAGRTVRARLCLPDGASQTRRVPGVIVLHGCGGFGTLDQTLAHRLPEHGIATYYVDYFGLTPAPNRKGFCNAHGAVGDAFTTWLRITRDATAALRRILAVDPQHVGAVGWSLGGGLALTAAEQYRHLFCDARPVLRIRVRPRAAGCRPPAADARPLRGQRRRRAGVGRGRALPDASAGPCADRAARLSARQPSVETRSVRRRTAVDARLP